MLFDFVRRQIAHLAVLLNPDSRVAVQHVQVGSGGRTIGFPLLAASFLNSGLLTALFLGALLLLQFSQLFLGTLALA